VRRFRRSYSTSTDRRMQCSHKPHGLILIIGITQSMSSNPIAVGRRVLIQGIAQGLVNRAVDVKVAYELRWVGANLSELTSLADWPSSDPKHKPLPYILAFANHKTATPRCTIHDAASWTLQQEREFIYKEPAAVPCITTITKTNGRCRIRLVEALVWSPIDATLLRWPCKVTITRCPKTSQYNVPNVAGQARNRIWRARLTELNVPCVT
jgi:hypothetical protein